MSGLDQIIEEAAQMDLAEAQGDEVVEDEQELEDTAEPDNDDEAQQEPDQEAEEEVTEIETKSEEATEEEKKAVEEFRKVLKVNGEEVVIESEEELLKNAQLGLAAHQKFQEASKIAKETQAQQQQIVEFVQMLKTNPDAIMPDLLGKDQWEKYTEGAVKRRLELEAMDPEKREMMELRRRAEAAEAQKKYIEEQEAQKQEQLRQQQELQQLDTMVGDILSKEQMHESEYLKKNFLFDLRDVEEGGHDILNLTPYQLVALAQKSRENSVSHFEETIPHLREDEKARILAALTGTKPQEVAPVVEAAESVKAEVVKPKPKKGKKIEFAEPFWQNILDGNV